MTTGVADTAFCWQAATVNSLTSHTENQCACLATPGVVLHSLRLLGGHHQSSVSR